MNKLVNTKNNHYIVIVSGFRSFYPYSYVSGAIICLLFAIYQMTNTKLFMYSGLTFCLVFALFGNIIQVLITLFFLCPNTYYLVVGSNAIFGYIAILLCFRLIKKYISSSFPLKPLIWCILLLIYSLLNDVYFSTVTLFISMIKIVVFVVLLIIVLKNTKDRQQLIIRLSNAYIWGALCSGVLGIMYYLYIGTPIITSNLNLRFDGLSKDPNYFSATLAFAIGLLVMKFFHLKKWKIYDLVSFAALFCLGLLTLSRGFLITVLAILLLSIPYLYLNTKISVDRKVLFTICFVIFLVLAYYEFKPMVILLLQRFTAKEYSGGSGRLEIWGWYMGKAFSTTGSFLFGSGSPWLMINSGVTKSVPHNTFLGMFYQIGLIGTTIFLTTLFVIYSYFRRISSISKKRFYSWIPFVSVVIPYSLLSALNGENFIFALLFSFAVLAFIGTEVPDYRFKNYTAVKKQKYSRAGCPQNSLEQEQ